MSAAYIQIHYKNTFTMESNTINPDQTTPKGAVWSEPILFGSIGYQST